jgi:uncharacterized protein (TIGR03382 family)
MSATLTMILVLVVSGQTPYVRSRVGNNPDSHCLWWPAGTLTLYQSATGIQETPGDAEFLALQRSLSTWRQALAERGNLQFVDGGRTDGHEIGFNRADPASNRNMLVFRTRDCSSIAPSDDVCWSESGCGNKYNCWDDAGSGQFTLALTTTTYDVNSGRLYDADIEINDANFYFTTADGPVCGEPESQLCAVTDVESTVTHEVGHLLGLDHSPDTFSTMFASAERGETSKRLLDPGTQQFILDVYPAGRAAQRCALPPPGPEPEPVVPEPGGGCDATAGSPLLAAGAVLALGARRRRR